MARTAAEVPFPLHPDIGLMAQCRRRLLRQIDQATAKCGVFKGIVDLQTAINRYLAKTSTPNPSSGPLTRTRSSKKSGAGNKRRNFNNHRDIAGKAS